MSLTQVPAASARHARFACVKKVTRPCTPYAQCLPSRGRNWSLVSDRRSFHICNALTSSTDLEIGASAPYFELPEPATGKVVSLDEFKGKPLLLMFICNHCPYVVHLKDAIVALVKEYQAKGVGAVAISSNSIQTHPQDGPEKMAEEARKYGYTFPYLYDEAQKVAKAYKAVCTPEFYIFDAQGRLVYHGQFDDSRPRNNAPVTGKDVRAALDAVLAGTTPPAARPSIGCGIKWHPGNSPDH